MTDTVEWSGETGPAVDALRHAAAGAGVGLTLLLVAGAGWAAVLLLVARWRPLVAVGLLAAATCVPVVTALLQTSGRVDPDAGIVTYGSRTFSIDGLDGVRRLPLLLVTVFWLWFDRGAVGSGVPRALVVPRRVAPAVRATLVDAMEDDEGDGNEDRTHHTPRTAERVVAATLGCGFLLAGPVAWVLLPASADATLVVGYLTLLGLPFAVVLLRYVLVQ